MRYLARIITVFLSTGFRSAVRAQTTLNIPNLVNSHVMCLQDERPQHWSKNSTKLFLVGSILKFYRDLFRLLLDRGIDLVDLPPDTAAESQQSRQRRNEGFLPIPKNRGRLAVVGDGEGGQVLTSQ